MPNDYRNFSDNNLNTWAITYSTTVAAAPTTFKTTTTKADQVVDDQTLYAEALSDLENARATFHAAVQTKEAARAALINSISIVAADIYTGKVAANLVASTGLVPHDTTHTRVTPQIPTDLTATPNIYGQVKLEWKKNGNPYGVVYVVETSTNTTDWTAVTNSTRRSVTLSGYTPGTMVWFRVRATKNGEMSDASNVTQIYAPSSMETPLQEAA